MGNDVSSPSHGSAEQNNQPRSNPTSMVGNLQNKLANLTSSNFTQDLLAKPREYAEKLHLTKSKSA